MNDLVLYNGAYNGPQVDAAVSRALSGGALDQAIAALQAAVGSPLVAATAAAMTDHNKIYVYTGTEAGYIAGDWYYWNGSAWADGGTYNAVAVDMALSDSSNNAVANRIVKAAIDANTAAIASVAETAAYALAAFPTETDAGSVAHTDVGADGVPVKDITIDIDAVIDGSGDPSWANMRNITGWSNVDLSHSGADTSDPTVRTIALGLTLYGGTLAIHDDGTATLERTFGYAYAGADGTLVTPEAAVTTHTWQGQVNNQPRVYSGLGDAVVNGGEERFCNVYPNNTVAINDQTNGFNITDSGTTHRCYFRDTSVPGWSSAETANELAETWTSYLAEQYANGKMLQIIYPLATPTVTELSVTQVKSLLGDNNIWANTGSVSVTYRCDLSLYLDQFIGGA